MLLVHTPCKISQASLQAEKVLLAAKVSDSIKSESRPHVSDKRTPEYLTAVRLSYMLSVSRVLQYYTEFQGFFSCISVREACVICFTV